MGEWTEILTLGDWLCAWGVTPSPSGTPSKAPPTPVSKNSPGPRPSSRPRANSIPAADLTWISAQPGWALATTPGCSGVSCRAVLATRDGGRTWTPITQLAACLTQRGAGAEQVTDVRCASPAIGYLYDSFASSSFDDDHRRWPPVVRRARSRDRRSRRKRWSGNPGQRIRHRLSGLVQMEHRRGRTGQQRLEHGRRPRHGQPRQRPTGPPGKRYLHAISRKSGIGRGQPTGRPLHLPSRRCPVVTSI